MQPTRPFNVSKHEYPFEDHWFDYLDSAMHYLDLPRTQRSNDEADDIPIVMLHGNPTWSFLYRRVIKSIDGKHRCIAPDYPGFGFSGHPKDYNYSPQEHADAVVALLDHLKLERYILMIQDWGGPIGIDIATRYPERVAGLVIGNTWSWKPDGVLTLFSKTLGGPVGRYLIKKYNLFTGYFMKSALEQTEEQAADIINAYSDAFPTPESRIGTWVFPKAISGESAWLQELERKLYLLADVPVELVWGMQDPIMARKNIINRWQLHFPQANFTAVDNAGHFLQENAHQQLANAVYKIQQSYQR